MSPWAHLLNYFLTARNISFLTTFMFKYIMHIFTLFTKLLLILEHWGVYCKCYLCKYYSTKQFIITFLFARYIFRELTWSILFLAYLYRVSTNCLVQFCVKFSPTILWVQNMNNKNHDVLFDRKSVMCYKNQSLVALNIRFRYQFQLVERWILKKAYGVHTNSSRNNSIACDCQMLFFYRGIIMWCLYCHIC